MEGRRVTALLVPALGSWVPWAMRRWPHLTRAWVEHAAHRANASWRADYRRRVRYAMKQALLERWKAAEHEIGVEGGMWKKTTSSVSPKGESTCYRRETR